jgi:hypothetical protein
MRGILSDVLHEIAIALQQKAECRARQRTMAMLPEAVAMISPSYDRRPP